MPQTLSNKRFSLAASLRRLGVSSFDRALDGRGANPQASYNACKSLSSATDLFSFATAHSDAAGTNTRDVLTVPTVLARVLVARSATYALSRRTGPWVGGLYLGHVSVACFNLWQIGSVAWQHH